MCNANAGLAFWKLLKYLVLAMEILYFSEILSCSLRAMKLCQGMTHGGWGMEVAHAHCLSSCLWLRWWCYSSRQLCMEEGVLVRCSSCCYMAELGTVDGACSCIGLSQVDADGDCHL